MDGGGGGVELDVGTEGAGVLDEMVDEVGVEAGERASAAVEDGDVGTGAEGDVGEFKGDVTAADEEDALGEVVEVEELLAVDEVFVAGEVEVGGLLAGSDEDEAGVEFDVADVEGGRAGEAGAAVEGGDAGLGEGSFALGGDGVGEGALEAHEGGPVDVEVRGFDAIGVHAASPVGDFCGTDEDFFGVAAAESAGATEGAGVDDGDVPAGCAAVIGGG